MELVKNIFFNTDKIVENTEIKVTYAGTLFQNGTGDVTIHYGFGNSWECAKDVPMVKTELGYQATIYVQEGWASLNFCFKNSAGQWDNNDGTNYTFYVEKQTTEENSVDVEKNNVENWEENSVVPYQTPSWGELFKRTINNFANYISRLFGKETQKVKNDGQ